MADEPDAGSRSGRGFPPSTRRWWCSAWWWASASFARPPWLRARRAARHCFSSRGSTAGLISLIGALTFAEIGSRYPRAGGYYRVVADCYHPTLAFMLNWSQTLMQGAGAAGVAFIGAEYLMPVILPPQWRTPHASLVLACATMLILLVFNYRGVKPGARVQNLLSLLKIVMIVGLAVLALLLAPRTAWPSARCVRAGGTAPGIGVDPVLLRLRGIPIDHESGRRLEGCAPTLPARHHGRHVHAWWAFISC